METGPKSVVKEPGVVGQYNKSTGLISVVLISYIFSAEGFTLALDHFHLFKKERKGD